MKKIISNLNFYERNIIILFQIKQRRKKGTGIVPVPNVFYLVPLNISLIPSTDDNIPVAS